MLSLGEHNKIVQMLIGEGSMIKNGLVCLMSLAALLLLAAPPAADAAPRCNLAGKWDVFLILSHLDDAETERVAWPPTAATCSITIDRDGALPAGLHCDGVFEGDQFEVLLEGFDLTLDKNCRISPDASLFAEVQTPLIQTQDQYSCRPEGTMVRSGQVVHGLLACGHVPEPFTMVRRRD